MPKFCGELFIVRPIDALYWIDQSAAGNPVGTNLIRCIGRFLAKIAKSSVDPLCAVCDHRFANHEIPAGMMIIAPLIFDKNDTATAVVSGICDACCDRDDLQDAVMAFARTAFSGPIDFHTHPPGRA
jgi:hypothetical protein